MAGFAAVAASIGNSTCHFPQTCSLVMALVVNYPSFFFFFLIKILGPKQWMKEKSREAKCHSQGFAWLSRHKLQIGPSDPAHQNMTVKLEHGH
jgi:hypothetical protein